MGSILQQITETSTTEVEAGGFHWRVRKVSSADLARVGHASLVVAQAFPTPEGPGKASAKKKKGQAPTNGEEVLNGQDASAFASIDPEALYRMAELKSAIVMAGTVAVGDGDEWEAIELVSDPELENAEAGKVWIGSLPPDVDDAIFNEVMSLSTDGGAAMTRLAAFRGTARPPAPPRPSRAAVRKAAK